MLVYVGISPVLFQTGLSILIMKLKSTSFQNINGANVVVKTIILWLAIMEGEMFPQVTTWTEFSCLNTMTIAICNISWGLKFLKWCLEWDAIIFLPFPLRYWIGKSYDNDSKCQESLCLYVLPSCARWQSFFVVRETYWSPLLQSGLFHRLMLGWRELKFR